jgi:hypothetical protein
MVRKEGSMIDTYTKVILTVIAFAMVVQLVRSEIHHVAGSQLGQICGKAGEPCYVKFSVADRPCGEGVERPCTPERP